MFLTFNQNNSGGRFEYYPDKGISRYVIIEGDNKDEIIDTALDIGIYFNGVKAGRDCECCGDRWYDSYYDNLSDEPLVYNENPLNYKQPSKKTG